MKYTVEITETLQTSIEVEANDRTMAITRAKRLYTSCDIELNDTHFIGTTFEIRKEEK
ncbi:MAG: hypothetical protein II996_07110 [Oscillospiraceae bacterium]|nr:hypothetical protein [Oscillospiraceae bacterium]